MCSRLISMNGKGGKTSERHFKIAISFAHIGQAILQSASCNRSGDGWV